MAKKLMGGIYRICVPHTNRDYFDYEDEELNPQIGSRVWVSFRNQTRLGIVVGKEPSVSARPLKKITALIDDEPILPKELLTLCLWISSYYQSPLSEILPLALPKKYRQGQVCQLPMLDYFQLQIPLEEAQKRISPRAHKQLELIHFLNTQKGLVSKPVLLKKGFNASQLAGLLSAQIISVSSQSSLPKQERHQVSPALTLNEEQAHALTIISAHLHHYHCFLLRGVTGSGKTEVYLQLIAQILKQGKQALVLVPEISLTPQLLARFNSRFTEAVVVIHSYLNDSERQIAWQLAKENEVKIVIGTRSSVFTPMPNLGLIIIDEEHDSSLKQMEGVRYSARDTALMRAHFANIPIVLGSATPSLESLHNCQQNKYTLLELNSRALTTTPLQYQLIDLRAQHLQHGLAKPTLKLIEEHLGRDNQVLVFINRRGFAPVMLCHLCGWMADCNACDSHLTFHKQKRQMICHHCGVIKAIPLSCPHCTSRELIPLGTGTQRIEEFLTTYFPKTSILRIDRDEIRHKNTLHMKLDQINKGEAQLIIGTQMLAKGHHFPRLSLVVVLDTDAGFYNQDFRAIEHLGQLLTQVAGRAGRAEQAGQVLIQTHLPQHPLLNLLIQQGYDEFAHALLSSRKLSELPPYHFLALIRAQGTVLSQVVKFLQSTKEYIKIHPLIIMGPAPAPLPRKANQYRMQLLIKSPSRILLKNTLTQLREWLATRTPLNKGVRWNMDVDPMDLS